MPTLKDISKFTGVSVTQVSRALGGYSDVSRQTREKVLQAVKVLGYHPNPMARGLRTGRSGIVAMVLPKDSDPSTQELLFEMVAGLSLEFAKRSLKLILHVSSTEGAESYQELRDWGGVDGFVVLGPGPNDERIAFLNQHEIPFVVHGRDSSQTHPFVDVDNPEIGRALAEQAIASGAGSVLLINGPEHRSFAIDRNRTCVARLKEAGIKTQSHFGPMTRERGRSETLAALASDTPPELVIAGNTMVVAGIYDAANEQGIALGKDLTVLVHDDCLKGYVCSDFVPPPMGTRSALSDAWQELAVSLERSIAKGMDPKAGVILKTEILGAA